MRKIVAAENFSLDGVVQAPGGPEEDPTGGFRFGGWTVAYVDDAVAGQLGENFKTPFDLLLGRKTYDIFAAYWPYVDVDPKSTPYDEGTMSIAKTFNRVTKYVATHSPDTLSWQNSRGLGRDVVASLRELKKEDGPNLLVWGSSELLQTLLANDLVDELQLLIYPLVLGKGKRLFGEGTIPAALKLVKSKTSPSGVLMASYERAGEVKTGSFGLHTPSEAELDRRRKLK